MPMPLCSTSRLLALLPDPDAPQGYSSAPSFHDRAEALGLRVIRSSPYLVALECKEGRRPACDGDETTVIVATYPGVPPLESLHIDPGPLQKGQYRSLERSVQFFNVAATEALSFSVTSDPLSLLPYYYGRLPHGYVVGSRLHDILAVFPELASPYSPLGMLEAFVYGSPSGNRTVHAGLFRPYPGESIHWTPQEGWKLLRNRLTPNGRLSSVGSAEQAADALFPLHRDYVQERLALNAKAPLIPLSGGLDSRLIACLVSGVRPDAQAVTLGLRRHDEYQVAKRIAKELSLSHRLVSTRRPYLTDVRDTLQYHEGQAGTGAAYIANLPIEEADRHRPLLHGFVGGSISGAHLKWVPQSASGTLDAVADTIFSATTRSVSRELPTLLSIPVSFDEIRHQIRRELHPDVEPYQAVIFWDIENRQRLRVFRQIAYLAQTCHVFCPSYDRDIIASWLSMPRPLLEKQVVLRTLLARQFPRVAALPRADYEDFYRPKTWSAATYWMRLFARKAERKARHVLGLPLDYTKNCAWDTFLVNSEESSVIDRQLLEENHAEVGRVLGYALPTFNDVFLDKLASRRSRARKLMARAMILGEYTKSLSSLTSEVGDPSAKPEGTLHVGD